MFIVAMTTATSPINDERSSAVRFKPSLGQTNRLFVAIVCESELRICGSGKRRPVIPEGSPAGPCWKGSEQMRTETNC